MSPADVPGGLLLDYRVDNGIAVVTVTGEVDVSTSPSFEMACFGSSLMRSPAAWS